MTAPDERLTFDLIARDRASREFDKVGDAAVKAGRDFDKASDGAGHLQMQLDDTTKSLHQIGLEFDKTGDRALLKDISKERRTLAGLTKLRKEMAGLADDTAKVASAGGGLFSGVSGAFGPQGRTAIIGGLVAAGLTAAPMIGAAITGAVVGAVGSGVIAAGIAGAARSSEVKSAWALLALEGKAAFSDFSQPFVEPTVDAINVLRGSLAAVSGDLDAIAEDASRFVGPLARGLGGFLEEAVGGIRDLVDEADPIFDMFGTELPRLGRSVHSFFRSLGNGAEGGADALRALLRITEATLAVLGPQLEIWAKQIELVADASRKAAIFAGPLAFLFDDVGKGAESGGAAFDTFIKGLDETSDAAQLSADRIGELNQRFDDLFDKTMNLDQANVDFKLGLIDLGETLKDNNETIDDANERWLANQDALLGMIRQADGVRDAAIDMGNGTEEASRVANAAYDAQLEQIRKVALAMQVPIDKINELIARYNAARFMPNIVKTITFVQQGIVPGGPRGTIIAQAQGGIVKAAQGAIVNSPTVLFGERAAGQEVFIPQNISRQRGLALSAVAAGMHGGSVVPNERMGGGGMGPVTFDFSGLRGGDELLAQWFHRNLSAGTIQLRAGGSRVVVG